MLLNTTIQAQIASTTAFAATVIAGLFVRSASPAVAVVVPVPVDPVRSMRWRYQGQPCDSKQHHGHDSKRCRRSLCRSTTLLMSSSERALNLTEGNGCETGPGRS